MKRHRPSGNIQIILPHKTIERDSFTCKHCQQIVEVKPFCNPADMGGRCSCCDGLICPLCVGKTCVPWEKRLEEMEASYHARRSYEF